MRDTVQIAKKAIELRRLGYSYNDIASKLNISKTSVSNWVKNVRLTEIEKIALQKNLKAKMEKGRLNASISIRTKKIFKEKIMYENIEKDFPKLQRDSFFMLGMGLYLSHGLKQGSAFQFTSADVNIIKIILVWMEKYLNLSCKMAKYRVFLDISHKDRNCEEIWSRIVGIPHDLFQKTVYIRSRNNERDREYKGSLEILVIKVEVLRKVIAWQKLLMRYYS
ncbi:MAG TPA: hypothetical protein VJJ28_00295 [Candidatus Paceibacterota bacterium]